MPKLPKIAGVELAADFEFWQSLAISAILAVFLIRLIRVHPW